MSDDLNQAPPEEPTIDQIRESVTPYVPDPAILDNLEEDKIREYYTQITETEKAKIEEALKSKGGDGKYPENWREEYIKARGGDDKMMNRLKRYASPEAALDALISVQNKIHAGELTSKTSFPENGTPEEQAIFQFEFVPEAADGYELKLKDGLVPGEEDQDIIKNFMERAHKNNWPNEMVNEAVQWYYDLNEQETELQHQEDLEIKKTVEDQLRAEWGNDYRKNINMITAYLNTGPAGTTDKILGARLQDGTPLASDPDMLHFLIDKAREHMPEGDVAIVPGDTSTQLKSIEDEISQLRELMKDKNSKYWKGDESAKLQDRYRQLLDARERRKAKGG